jgi:hypothetical protein
MSRVPLAANSTVNACPDTRWFAAVRAFKVVGDVGRAALRVEKVPSQES